MYGFYVRSPIFFLDAASFEAILIRIRITVLAVFIAIALKMLSAIKNALSGVKLQANKFLLRGSRDSGVLASLRELSVTSAQERIIKSPYPDVTFTGRNFFELMWSASETHGHSIALVS